jgi:hypothetical protein
MILGDIYSILNTSKAVVLEVVNKMYVVSLALVVFCTDWVRVPKFFEGQIILIRERCLEKRGLELHFNIILKDIIIEKGFNPPLSGQRLLQFSL